MSNIRIMSLAVWLIVLIFGVKSYAETPPLNDNAQITLKLRPISPNDISQKKLWQELLNISKPVQLNIDAGESIKHAITRQCGSAPADLVAFIVNLNPGGGGEVEGAPRVWKSFPCPFWVFSTASNPLTVPVSKNQTLTDILPFHMGESGPKTVAAVKRLNPGIFSNDGVVKENVELHLPYIVKGTTIGLKDALADKPYEAIQQVTFSRPQLADDAVFQKYLPAATIKYKFVAEDLPVSDTTTSTCVGPNDADTWPFDLNTALALLEKGKKQQDTASPEAVVLVVDTGFAYSLEKSGLLWVNKRVKNSMGSVTDYFGDLHGANLVETNGDISPSTDYPLSSHGTDVFSILSGGNGDTAKLATFLVIAGGKIVTSSPPFSVDRAALHLSFGYATQITRQNPSVVINLSVVSTGQILGLSEALKATNLLVIAAAGNNHDRVDSLDIYPPAFPDYRERLIVVGAHDWANNIAAFSNRGILVDLLAPGCKLNVKDAMGNVRVISGTSFAAPFVSLTAGMLSSLGLKPWEVKNRILASVDFSPQLIDLVSTGGRLNVLNALRITTDILMLRDPVTKQVSTIFGAVDTSKNWICHRGTMSTIYRPTEIARLIGDYPSVGGKAIRLITSPRSSGGLLYQTPCDSLSGLLLFNEDGKESRSIDWADVVGIVFSTKYTGMM